MSYFLGKFLGLPPLHPADAEEKDSFCVHHVPAVPSKHGAMGAEHPWPGVRGFQPFGGNTQHLLEQFNELPAHTEVGRNIRGLRRNFSLFVHALFLL